MSPTKSSLWSGWRGGRGAGSGATLLGIGAGRGGGRTGSTGFVVRKVELIVAWVECGRRERKGRGARDGRRAGGEGLTDARAMRLADTKARRDRGWREAQRVLERVGLLLVEGRQLALVRGMRLVYAQRDRALVAAAGGCLEARGALVVGSQSAANARRDKNNTPGRYPLTRTATSRQSWRGQERASGQNGSSARVLLSAGATTSPTWLPSPALPNPAPPSLNISTPFLPEDCFKLTGLLLTGLKERKKKDRTSLCAQPASWMSG